MAGNNALSMLIYVQVIKDKPFLIILIYSYFACCRQLIIFATDFNGNEIQDKDPQGG